MGWSLQSCERQLAQVGFGDGHAPNRALRTWWHLKGRGEVLDVGDWVAIWYCAHLGWVEIGGPVVSMWCVTSCLTGRSDEHT